MGGICGRFVKEEEPFDRKMSSAPLLRVFKSEFRSSYRWVTMWTGRPRNLPEATQSTQCPGLEAPMDPVIAPVSQPVGLKKASSGTVCAATLLPLFFL